jgi:outer membrane lipoprotein SlyB
MINKENLMKLKKTFGVLMLSSSLALAGCAGTGSSSSSLDSGDDAKFFSSSGWGSCAWGAAGGAALGALTGLLTGGDTESTVAGAAIGGAAGCAAGMSANYYLEKQRKTYVKKEDRLNAYIADVRQNSQMVQKSTEKLNAATAKNNQLIAKVNSQLKSGTIQKAEAKQQLAQVDADIKAAKERLSVMKSNLNMLSDTAKAERSSGASSKRLDQEISQLRKQVSTYEQALQAQVKQRSAIQVG